MIGFWQCDVRCPWLWEGPGQPAARWHAGGEGPAHYFADTPDGAWADFLRHEEIRDAADLATVRRAIWAVDLGEEAAVRPALTPDVMRGDRASYAACQEAARGLRASGHRRLEAPSASLLAGGATGRHAAGGRVGAGPVGAGTVGAGNVGAGNAGAGQAGAGEGPCADAARGGEVERGAPASRDGRVLVLYGEPGELGLKAWPVAAAASPPADLLARVRHYGAL